MSSSMRIHLIWGNKHNWDNPNTTLPYEYHVNLNTWKHMNPNCEIKIWSSEDIQRQLENTWNMTIYRAYQSADFMGKISIAKLLILYYYGGLYVDFNVICNRPVSDFLMNLKASMLIVSDSEETINTSL